jgi:hypothetical protein
MYDMLSLRIVTLVHIIQVELKGTVGPERITGQRSALLANPVCSHVVK